LYDTYIKAADEGDKERVDRAEVAIKKHVTQDSNNIKNLYTKTGITIDLAVMFIPSESLMQLIDSIGNLRQEVFRDNRVLILGPNSLAAYLISINMGFKTLALNERAEEVIVALGDLKSEFENFTGSTDNLVRKADAMVTAVDEHETRERAMTRAFRNMDNLLEEDEETQD
jgi:DNA recombination protein RmuC